MSMQTARIEGSPDEALAKWFKDKPEFRDRQREALCRVWEGKSSLVLMPTGRGKSLVVQLPVLASGGIGVIISPLIALMEQQAQTLRGAGAAVLSLGGSDAREAQEALRRFDWAAGPSFLFVSPERAETDGYLEYLLRKHRDRVTLVAVDEAHCISQWGHDFRPPYKAIPGFLDRAFGRDGWPVVLCLTATLDRHNQQEILSDFRLGPQDVVRSPSMLRDDLDLSFRVFPDGAAKLGAVEAILDARRGEKLIVYTHLKQNKTAGTRALAERFKALGHRCTPFDADLPMAEKEAALAEFVSGKVDLVFATGAFGMGIDVPDIRGVIHFLLPESLEQYYQEVGRAGRDGKGAFGVLLYTAVNTRVRRDLIRQASRAVDQVSEVWTEVCATGRSELRTITPWTEFQGKDDEYALFYAFQRLGILTVVARGPGRLHCFEARGPEGAALLQRLNSATKIGNTAAAIRKLGLDPQATMAQLFDLYDRPEIRLTRSPDKTLLFTTREPQDDELQSIADDVTEKVGKRLAGFDTFVELIESGADPTEALKARFGET
jgi:ATP-dependent DNA helicase RecQ